MHSLPANIAHNITETHLSDLGLSHRPQLLLVAGWSCQHRSTAGLQLGPNDTRSSSYDDVRRILGILQQHSRTPVRYLLENVVCVHPKQHNVPDPFPYLRPSSNPIVDDERHIIATLHAPSFIIDAPALGSAAHRLRAFWSNLVDATAFSAALAVHQRPPILLGDLLQPHHYAQLTQPERRNPPPFYQGNVLGCARNIMPTFVSTVASYAFRYGREGLLVNEQTQTLEPPSADERERCMGYPTGFTAGLQSEQARVAALGQAFDLNTIITILEASALQHASSRPLKFAAAAVNMQRIAAANRALRSPAVQHAAVAAVDDSLGYTPSTVYLDSGADGAWGRLPEAAPEIMMPPAPGAATRCTPFNINPLLPERLRAQLRGLLENWRSRAFAEDLSELTEINSPPFEIDVQTTTPVSVPKRRMNPTNMAFITAELTEMEKYGIIRKSTSPYGAPTVVVRQGEKMRLCIDYRRLNEVTVKRQQPMPLVGETLDAMVGANVFCVADMHKGFWQQPVAEKDRHKTAFYGPDALWEFNRMPFGLVNAPAAFQSFSNGLVRDLPGTEAFVDDLITGIHEPTLPAGVSNLTSSEVAALDTDAWNINTTLERVTGLLRAVVRVNARLNIRKCFFGYFAVDALGFVLSDMGRAPQQRKIRAIQGLPVPRNIKELRGFLGCCSFYREHMPHFTRLAAPLTVLLKKDAPFNMGAAQLQAVSALKDSLSSAPCLRLPDFTKTFYLYTDWSVEGIGAVLMQRSGPDAANAPVAGCPSPLSVAAPSTGFHAIAYASRSNNSAERNLSAFDGELLAHVWAFTKWSFYLSNARFVCFTDHQALTWLLKSRQELPPKHARWALRIGELDFEIQHTPGDLNVVADHLSRSFHTPSSPTTSQERTIMADTIHTVSAILTRWQSSSGSQDTTTLAAAALSEVPSHSAADVWTDEAVLDVLRGGPAPSGNPAADRRVLDRAAGYRWQHLTDPPQPVNDTVPSSGLALLNTAAQHYGGRLFRISRSPTHSDKEVPPPSVRVPLATMTHIFWLHPGRTRTFFRLQPRYWWPGIFQDVATAVATCQPCAMARSRAVLPAGPLQPLPIMGLFYRFNVDLAGPLIPSTRGNVYVMIVVEHLTGTVILSALPRKTPADTAAAFARQTLAVFGAPACVVTDQGNEWLGEFKALMVAWAIDHRPTSRNHPQANGKAERTVQTVKAAHRACNAALGLEGPPADAFDWDEQLPRLQLALNSSAQSSTGQSAYFLLFGRHLLYPSEIRTRFADPLDASDAADTRGDEALVRAALLRDHTITAMGNQLAAQHRDTERYATVRTGEYIRRTTTFAPGHLVWLVRKQLHSTDAAVREIILIIVNVDGNVITMQGRCGRTTKDHATNIRRCHLLNIDTAVDTSLRRTSILDGCERCLGYDSPAANRMLVCDTCSTCWHCACCTPPMSTPPAGNWHCQYCTAVRRTSNTAAAAAASAAPTPPAPSTTAFRG